MKANEQCRWRETENEDWELVHGTQVIGKVMLCQEADDPDGCFYTAWVAPPAGERTSLVGMMDVTAKFMEEEGDEKDLFDQAAEWVMEEVEKRHGLKSPASQKRAAEADEKKQDPVWNNFVEAARKNREAAEEEGEDETYEASLDRVCERMLEGAQKTYEIMRITARANFRRGYWAGIGHGAVVSMLIALAVILFGR